MYIRHFGSTVRTVRSVILYPPDSQFHSFKVIALSLTLILAMANANDGCLSAVPVASAPAGAVTLAGHANCRK